MITNKVGMLFALKFPKDTSSGNESYLPLQILP